MQNGIYNGDGLRLKKVAGSTTTLYAWDVASGLPLVLLDGPSGSQASYIYGPGGLPDRAHHVGWDCLLGAPRSARVHASPH
jgi:hypothetical protein